MAKVVFMTKINPTYDDLPEERYHFPRQYLNQVRQAVGDMIVYYEPRRQDADDRGREGRQSYFAIAQVENIEEDRNHVGHYYARVSNYLEFDQAVPFRLGQNYFESALQKEDGSTNRGAFGRAVRVIPDRDFEKILAAGFAIIIGDQQPADDTVSIPGLGEERENFERPILEQLVRRPFRDTAFSRKVTEAYARTCAFTGLKIINGRGRAEIEAAHIQPVGEGHNGPDSVRNGIGLSRTVHWMFDRGLLSISDDYEILASKNLPSHAKRFLNSDGRILVPDSTVYQPHARYLRYHRDNIFKG